MLNEEFKNLITESEEWVKLSKRRGYDFDSLLAGLYNDPSHFIYEMLQNAEDEKATEVRFELFDDRLDIYHDGKPFDFEDIKGVTGIGISTKKGKPDAIGKFGVGFKSVFAITETPIIFSGEYKIQINDFVVPSIVADERLISETLISLPFNHRNRKEKAFHIVLDKLSNLGLKTLLFLKNIKEIQWKTPSESGHYLKSSEDIQEIAGTKKVTLISAKDTEEYIVIEKPLNVEAKELKIEVAYKLERDKNGKGILIPEPDSRLFVFFPTEKVTFLNFVIQGPYKTTPNRGDIRLDEDQNKSIIEETGNLIAESLSVIKKLGYLDANFLKLLPINPFHKERDQIYAVIYEKIKKRFLSDEELLPTFDGNYIRATDALLARGKELTEFLGNDDVQSLFGKKNWLDTEITYDRTKELRDYIINELKVEEVDFESFAKKITAPFLQEKPDGWMIDFYCRLLNQEALWRDKGHASRSGILRTKPIIRLEANEHIVPFDNIGKAQVYLPTEIKSQYKTVKRALTENEDSLKFLKALGLDKPNIFAEIKEFILPKYQANVAKDEGYFEDFEKLLTAYESIPSNKKTEFIKQLSNISFVDSVDNATAEHSLLKPSGVYLRDPDLKEYFNGIASVYFVSDDLYDKFGDERLSTFLMDIGVEDKPRRIEIEKVADLSWEEKVKFTGNTGRDVHQKDFEYEGLNTFAEQITTSKSYLLWKLISRNIANMSTWKAREFFEGEYNWDYYGQQRRSFDAGFIKTLRQQVWLVDKTDNFKKASDITFAELSDNYSKESPNIDMLIKALEFKPDIIDQLPETEKQLLKLVKEKGLTIEDIERLPAKNKREQELQQKDKVSDWAPEFKPHEIEIKLKEIEPEKIVTLDLKGQSELLKKGNSETPQSEKINENKAIEIPSPGDSKKIGGWGEEHVYHALKKKYEELGAIVELDFGFKVNHNNEEFEVTCLNKPGNTGKGYDFVIKKNGVEIEYIEVKTKVQEAEELIEVTGTQWEFARKLYDQSEGEKYSHYVVSNAGKLNAEIRILRNPIKLWKDGKLYAHPINFKI